MKRKDDVEKAHQDRMRDVCFIQKLFNGSGLHMRKIGDCHYYWQAVERKILNSLPERYVKTETLARQFGHHAVVWHDDKPDYFRYVEIRYPERGFYWKAPVNDETGFDILKALNPLFVILHHDDYLSLKYLALLFFDNYYMKKSNWQKQESESNKNRWDNRTIRRHLKTTIGFDVNNEREKIISTFYSQLQINGG